jgi:hypothetical protein
MENCEHQPETGARESSQSPPDSEAAGAWTFSALVRGTEWDPSLFTSLLNQCASSAFSTTLDMTSIFSYACSDRSTGVPDGYVAVDGYLKLNGSAK